MQKTSETSTNEDMLILVNDQDIEIGSLSKVDCHLGEGTLHRAFSVFIFNQNGQLLLQQRSEKKPLWPLFWSNSCCSHPRQGESLENATQRRIREELGLNCPLNFLYKFKYQAHYQNIGSEHELCHVFYGFYDGEVTVNSDEIADWCFLSVEDLSIDLQQNAEQYSPWFKMEWETIGEQFLDSILSQHNE